MSEAGPPLTPARIRRHQRSALAISRRQIARQVRLLRRVWLTLEKSGDLGDQGKYPFAYALLASKCVSHADSVSALTDIGRYGDAFVILRVLLSETLMARYLLEFPSEVVPWLTYAKERPSATKAERLRLQRRFADSRIRKRLLQRGLNVDANARAFAMLSEPAHASSWGIMFYAKRDLRGKFTLVLDGYLDAARGVELAQFMMIRLSDILNTFSLWAQQQGVPRMLRLSKRFLALHEDLERTHGVIHQLLDKEYARLSDTGGL